MSRPDHAPAGCPGGGCYTPGDDTCSGVRSGAACLMADLCAELAACRELRDRLGFVLHGSPLVVMVDLAAAQDREQAGRNAPDGGRT